MAADRRPRYAYANAAGEPVNVSARNRARLLDTIARGEDPTLAAKRALFVAVGMYTDDDVEAIVEDAHDHERHVDQYR